MRRPRAEALRAEGLVVQTLAERYPETEEFVEDEDWIRDVTAGGLVILMKDNRIRRKPREQTAILDSGARAFVVMNANLTGEQLAELFVIATGSSSGADIGDRTSTASTPAGSRSSFHARRVPVTPARRATHEIW